MLKDVDNLKKEMEIMQNKQIRRQYQNNCYKYVKNSFDSNLLCQKILERKIKLLKN